MVSLEISSACHGALAEVHNEKPNFHPSYDSAAICHSPQFIAKISANFRPLLQLVVSVVLGHHFCTNFLQSKFFSVDIKFICNHSDSNMLIILHQSSHLLDVSN
jgi:hypothetical protein